MNRVRDPENEGVSRHHAGDMDRLNGRSNDSNVGRTSGHVRSDRIGEDPIRAISKAAKCVSEAPSADSVCVIEQEVKVAGITRIVESKRSARANARRCY